MVYKLPQGSLKSNISVKVRVCMCCKSIPGCRWRHHIVVSQPCMALSICSYVTAHAGELFVPAVFVLFNAGDMAGRMAAGWGLLGRQPPQGAALVGYAAVRTLLALALALCNVTVAHTWTLPVVFK